MPPLPTPGAVLRVEFLMGINASIEAGSRFFLSYSGGPPNSTDLNTLATDIADSWESTVASQVSTTESLHGVTVTDLSSDTGALGVWTGTKAGAYSGGTPLTASVCAVVNHQTGVRYRGGHPRTYLRCGVIDSEVLNGTNEWTSTFQASVTSVWEAWIAAILAVSTLSITLTNIVNVSWYQGVDTSTPPWRGPGYKYPPKLRTTPRVETITGSSCALKLGSQRRRLNT